MKKFKLSWKAVAAFAVSFGICMVLLFTAVSNRVNQDKLTMELLIMGKSIAITEVISKLLYKTQTLAALVISSNGEVRDFNKVASIVVDDPSIFNILLAPNGVVSNVYPTTHNEILIGYNLFGEGLGNEEARMARDSGRLVFSGPFAAMQGGRALAGRYPVFLDSNDGDKKFWGLVSVTLKYPQVLNSAALDALVRQGYSYEIWRINPDDGERQVIAGEGMEKKRARFIEKPIHIMDTEWFFRISPVLRWYEYSLAWIFFAASVLLSALIGLIVQNNIELKVMKSELEDIVFKDHLTGITNRKGLWNMLGQLTGGNHPFMLYIIDLNHFKAINDNYGHNMGDFVLVEFCKRIGKHIKEDFLLARIGGDEFALLISGFHTDAEMSEFWEKVGREFEEPIFKDKSGISCYLSFSRGVAKYPEDSDSIKGLVAKADKNMYTDKNERYTKDKKRRITDV